MGQKKMFRSQTLLSILIIIVALNKVSSTERISNMKEDDLSSPSLLLPYLGLYLQYPPPFLVNSPTFYRKKNPNWYLRFRHRNRRSASVTKMYLYTYVFI